jgi:hypothetical protein
VNLGHWLLPSQGRLSADDLRVLARLAPYLPVAWSAALVHPARHESKALPRFEAVSSRRWNLRFRAGKPYDVLVAGRMPGFSREQLFNLLASCQLLIVLDAQQLDGASSEALGEVSVPEGSLRLYRGQLCDPLLRVDDYPTGVRPILEDLSSLHEVLSLIDAAGLPFHLGVVPAILEDRMLPFLRSLSQLVVSMHGFEHGYAKHSKILLDANDPFNQRGTVSGFDEFAGQSYPEVLAKIQAGRQSLESRLGQLPASYIPPCNAGNRATGRALLTAGFQYVLSEKPVPGCDLPVIGSDFYDRSSVFHADLRPKVASLHATWEADMLRAGDTRSLPTFLAALVRQRSEAREAVAGVADRILGAFARG